MPASLQTAMVVADVSTGEVQALVGDRYPGRAGFNRAIHARRQVGSVIKPLVYLLALEHSERLQPGHPDRRRAADPEAGRTVATGRPANYDGKSHGEVSLLEALTRSYNQATVRLGLKMGVNNLINRIAATGRGRRG